MDRKIATIWSIALLLMAATCGAATAAISGAATHDAGRRMLAAASAAAPEPILPTQASSYPTSATRRLHQEHECPAGETWIHCNSQSLCRGIDRNSPSTQCGPVSLCVGMCETASQRGGVCAELWNMPTQTYYYSINHDGAVFCDPPRGRSGSSGSGRRRPLELRKLRAALSTHAQHNNDAAATAAAAQAPAEAPATASPNAAKTVAVTPLARLTGIVV